MNIKRLFILTGTVLSSLTLVWMCLFFLSEPLKLARAASDTYTVCLAGPPTCDYAVIQDAVDAASNGDMIKVAAGTYTDIHVRDGLTQVAYIDEDLTIQGGYTTTDWTTPDPEQNPTILDAQGQGRVVYIHHGKEVRLEGLHITGGDATAGGGPTNPYAPYPGGGVRSDGTLHLFNNWIYGNVADNGEGGGVAVRGDGNDIISGNLIYSNIASHGGGLMNSGNNAVLSGNQIVSNTVVKSHGGVGGGVFIGGNDIKLINNLIANNYIPPGDQAGGSGIYLAGSSTRLYHNTITNNLGAGDSGIGIGDFFGPASSRVAMTNTLISSQGTGIEISGSLPNTVTVNGILWYATPLTITHTPNASITVQNQYSGDPAFAADGYHLTSASAAIDRGVDSGIPRDIDGESRPNGLGYDLGADEFWWLKIYLPLVIR